jgi:hypothetical protein
MLCLLSIGFLHQANQAQPCIRQHRPHRAAAGAESDVLFAVVSAGESWDGIMQDCMVASMCVEVLQVRHAFH